MKHLIIGGVAGGATAAARIRRIDENAEIVILEKGKYISYANCGLPYYIGGTIQDRSRLFLQTPESFGNRFEVDVKIEHEAVRINPDQKTVTVRNHKGEFYDESYDKLLLSPGAAPIRPKIDGINIDGVFSLRNVPDTDTIKNYVTQHKIKKAVVIGAGFIGLEMAENLYHLGAQVSIVEKLPQVMAPIDFSMAQLVHQHLADKGVQLHINDSVVKLAKSENGILSYLDSGKIIDADIVILSIGVRPEINFIKDSPIKIGETGGIWVNEYLETSVPDIFAVGDAIEFPHPITGKPWLNYLANPANRQGRLVADNMVFGNQEVYEGSIGTSIAKVFDITVASTGLPAKKLQEMEIPFHSSWTHSGSHAGYYPAATQISLKLTFDPQSGQIFGAQGVGYDGVDKRIDQIALLIKLKKTIFDLMLVEHTYAPPFSSAKDPISIAGYVANNIFHHKMPIVTWREIVTANPEEVCIVDVRTKEEYEMGNITGAINIPVDELRLRLDEIPQDKKIIVHCAIGLRGYLALKILKQHGFDHVYNLSGGYKTYIAATTNFENRENPIFKKAEEANDFQVSVTDKKQFIQIDACGLQCPGPIMKLKKGIDEAQTGDQILISSTDAGFARDVESWCKTTNHILISNSSEKGIYNAVIEKSGSKPKGDYSVIPEKGKTFIMFSDDLDKALATFILANGAAATGEKATIFFTFWGLNVIKREQKPKVSKSFMDKMFSLMLPSSSLELKLSKLSMFGIGDRIMRRLMKKKGISSLETLRDQAIESGVEFIACQMSMDMIGVKESELIEGVSIGGVATYMERANRANVNLFI